ncbi:MAG: adenylate cyclase [Gammaproteobacteria bacterium]|jgi:adenylate cyclase
MQTIEQPVAILFADICDSTPLYESSGDWSALAVIARCLDELAELAKRFEGTIIRSKGDDLLCTFDVPDAALDAAEAMIGAYGSGAPAIHIGIHFGQVIQARDDIFGDAVNVAARMLSLAKPGEIVASSDLANALPDRHRDRLSLLGKQMLKGKQEPIAVYSIVLDEGDVTQMVRGSGAAGPDEPPETVMPSVVVELTHGDQNITIRDGQRCLIGRADRCDLVVEEPNVSREHAWVEVHRGRAMLTDQSSTGSWVIELDGSYTTLRRQAGALGQRGSIRLGVHPRDPRFASEIEFTLRVIM